MTDANKNCRRPSHKNKPLTDTTVILPKKNYFDLEPRINYRYKLSNNQNIKLSYSKMKQYMHQISSTSLILPTDLWYPITEYIKPQTSHQFAIATTYEFKKIKSNITIESFYKTMNNLTEYKEGVNTLFNNDINNIITQGKGEAYGFEFLFRKESVIEDSGFGKSLIYLPTYC